ncbi:unnamed protein product [Cylindrotheca closterium]|uniref:SAP domain-containing protein n=1 Tax=Cylindrotheca closterium TaxID=2856 RepID=A0AAD2G6B6_9STRA|nr:unnamed protein product [Cylindrotheca closterium]
MGRFAIEDNWQTTTGTTANNTSHAGDSSTTTTRINLDHVVVNQRRPTQNANSNNSNAMMIVGMPSFLTLLLTTAVVLHPTCDAWAGTATRRSTYYSSSTTIFPSTTTATALNHPVLFGTTTTSTTQQQQQQQQRRKAATAMTMDLRMQDNGGAAANSIRMLLDHSRFPSSLLTTTSQLVQSRPVDDTLLDSKSSIPKKTYGVLGFDVFQSPVGLSNVNLETWNNADAGDIGFQAMNARLAHGNIKDNNSNATTITTTTATTTTIRQEDNGLEILSKGQILAFKVPELKEACAKRGLLKMGNKADLQDRLLDWSAAQQQKQKQRKQQPPKDFVAEWFDDEDDDDDEMLLDEDEYSIRSNEMEASAKSPNSLEEWSRTVDLESLRKKRREIHRLKRQGSIPPASKKQQEEQQQRLRNRHADSSLSSSKEYLQKLKKTLETPSSQYSSNVRAKEIYMASKHADQAGDRETSIQLLQTLLTVTPNDGRVYRRLARIYNEQGETIKARSVLQTGLQKQPENPWLWHGLAQLLDHNNHGGSNDSKMRIKRAYQKAIQLDPTFAHSYHALGTFEHSEGNIAQAMRILKQGIKYCPTNHQLYHALGDIYRGARLLDDAERSYYRSLEHGSPINYCFAFSALAAVAFEKEEINNARKWLRKSIRLNNGRHAQGWVSLAQLEESQGNIDVARSICVQAITQYEAQLIESGKRYRAKYQGGSTRMRENDEIPGQSKSSFLVFDGMEIMDFESLMQQAVPRYRSGDRFLKVFRNWARFEQRHGTAANVDAVFSRALAAFPMAIELPLTWAKYHASNGNYDQARSLFTEACDVEHRNQIQAFQELAEFEISKGDYKSASKILYKGANVIASSEDGGLSHWKDLAKLYTLWAVCEWHNGNLPRAEVLFDQAMRQTNQGEEGAELRSFILYCMARFDCSRRKYILAQHCIGVCMKENAMPLGKSQVWKLWATIASAMKNTRLRDECLRHAEVSMKREHDEHPLLGPVNSETGGYRLGAERNFFRREPWQIELFGFDATKNSRSDFYSRVEFPSSMRIPVENRIEIEESCHC